MERKAEDSSFEEVNEVSRFKVTLGRKCVEECWVIKTNVTKNS